MYWTYCLVMVGAAACLVAAYRTRFDTPRHRRWGLAGVATALTGVVVVLVLTYALGWRVPQRFPEVVFWHRRLAMLATALLVLVAVSGARRWKIHPPLARALLPLYVVALILASIGYRP